MKAKYNRGWEYDKNLRKFQKRLNKKQASLQLDGVTINNSDKLGHYLHKLYHRGTFTDETVIKWNNKPTADKTYANVIILFEKKKYAIDKVCRITVNTKLGKHGFSITNFMIDWGNEAKDIITKKVTATIQQKYNEHPLALTDMCTANKRELQKISQALATLSKRVNGLPS